MAWKKLLLTSDLSDEAQRPFPMVSEMARALGFSIHMLYVVEDLPIAPHGAPLAPPMHAPSLGRDLKEAKGHLEEQAAKLGDGIHVDAEVISAANVAQAICKHAEENGCDAIALSTHGRSGFRRLVMGSVAEGVIRHASVPVLVFPRT